MQGAMATTSCGCGLGVWSRPTFTSPKEKQLQVSSAVACMRSRLQLRRAGFLPLSTQWGNKLKVGKFWAISLEVLVIFFSGACLFQFDPLPMPMKASLKKMSRDILAVAAPMAPISLSDADERARLAEAYGFTQIGEPIPEGVTLKNVIDSLPAEAFEIVPWKAWRNVAVSLITYSIGLVLIAKAPWYLLPLAWAWTGTAITGMFVIGHDCAHKSFSKNKLVEDIVGTLSFMPLIYPYEPWRFKHDRHHAKTNMLEEDTAWHPLVRDEWNSFPNGLKLAMEWAMGPLRPWGSIGHWWIYHFDLKKYRPSEQARVKISLAAVLSFVLVGWPAIIYSTGLMGWVKFWLMPWLGYHFWMSTFTMVHHTAPHIPFKDSKDWNSAAAQLGGTVHCDYPRWIEWLCHDISVHIPHHLSQKIPSYNLRLANESVRQNWSKHMNIATWNWRLMKTIMTQCHIYDEDRNYVSFDYGRLKESKVLGPLRRFMPSFR